MSRLEPKMVPRHKVPKYAKNNGGTIETRTHKYTNDKQPKGTPEEINQAIGKALEYQLKVLDYSDKDELPVEVVEQERRYLHYACRGPRRGVFRAYGNSKLFQADVLYILTNKKSAQDMADLFKVSKDLVLAIKAGRKLEWEHEFRLVRRIRASVRANIRMLYKAECSLTVWGIFTNEGELKQLITSERKAKKFMEDAYGNRKNNYFAKRLEVAR